MDNSNAWAWLNDSSSTAAPLGSQIKPSTEAAPAPVKDQTEQQLNAMILSKGIDATANGINAALKYKPPTELMSFTPVAETTGLAAAPAMSTAPLAAGVAEGATLGATAAEGAALGSTLGATAGTTAAATGAAGAGANAALAAMGPVGWAIAAGLLAKKLGIF